MGKTGAGITGRGGRGAGADNLEEGGEGGLGEPRAIKPKLLAKATRPTDRWFALPLAAQGAVPPGTRTSIPLGPRMPSVAFAIPAAANEATQRRATDTTRVVSRWEAAAAGVGEREFLGYPLQIELVPREAQGLNLRLFLSDACWDAIRKLMARLRQPEGGQHAVCELCQRETQNPDCHEQWSFNPATRTQKLEGLWCLCKACHAAKHLGRAYSAQKNAEENPEAAQRERKLFDHAMAKLQEVNGIGRAQADAYFRWALEKQGERDGIAWNIDLDWLFSLLALLQTKGVGIELRWSHGEKASAKAHQLLGAAAASWRASRPR